MTLAGERKAFSVLAERYYPGILRPCNRLLKEPPDAG
ncbi:uncharacterized protein METZ01_LOCUS285140, partial [marine metagenome]